MFPIQGNKASAAVKVCKTFFLHTLAVSERYVSTTHKLHSNMGFCREDQRGKHTNRPNKTSKTQMDFVRRHIESFTKTESHYCRKDTKKNT